jgi:hypothetical protein
LPDRPIIFVECKEVDVSSKRNTPIVKIKTTALQRDYLKVLRSLGLAVAVLVKVVVDKNLHKVYTIRDLDAEEFNMLHHHALELRLNQAKIWDVDLITALIE